MCHLERHVQSPTPNGREDGSFPGPGSFLLPGEAGRPYPILRSTARALASDVLSRVVFVGILHFLPNLLDFMRAFGLLGLRPERTFLGYKDYAYPERDMVVRGLTDAGYQVAALRDVGAILQPATSLARREGLRVVVVEDGGAATAGLAERVPALGTLVAGVVEQTTRGIRRISALTDLAWPVFDVASSRLKADYEARYVGSSTLHSIEHLLSELRLEGRPLTVLGYGRVGAAVCESARQRRMPVTVFDQDERRLARALAHGHRPVTSVERAVEGAWLVIGTTGTTSIDGRALHELRHGAYLASASSGSIEIDLATLRALAIDSHESGGVTSFRLEPDGRTVHLLAGGRPVNFHEFTAVPGEIIDLVLATMLVATHEVATARGLAAGLHDVDELVRRHALEEQFFRMYVPRP